MSFLRISKDDTELLLDDLAYIDAAALGYTLLWDRAGWVRKVPMALLATLIETYETYLQIKERHPETEVPPHADRIYWSQCRELLTPLGPEEVESIPLLDCPLHPQQ